jgi:hypothetical protein
MNYQLGKWYEAKRQVRAKYGEDWKGILLRKNRVAAICKEANQVGESGESDAICAAVEEFAMT